MIVELERTTTSQISKTLLRIRDEGGVIALGRVLSLIIHTQLGEEEDAIEAANHASREHPMRVLVVSRNSDAARALEEPRLDAEVRVGGDAGASEVVVLKCYGEVGSHLVGVVQGLLLPDAPVVAWWPRFMPDRPHASQIGSIAQRRITDASLQPEPIRTLRELADGYAPGDTDLAWTRTTNWRSQLAAVLDQPPASPITEASVTGDLQSPSVHLLGAWLRQQLGVPVAVRAATGTSPTGASGICAVSILRDSGEIVLQRVEEELATLTQPGQPSREVALSRRGLRDQLSEELRSLDPDDMYHRVLTSLAEYQRNAQ